MPPEVAWICRLPSAQCPPKHCIHQEQTNTFLHIKWRCFALIRKMVLFLKCIPDYPMCRTVGCQINGILLYQHPWIWFIMKWQLYMIDSPIYWPTTIKLPPLLQNHLPRLHLKPPHLDPIPNGFSSSYTINTAKLLSISLFIINALKQCLPH